MKGLPYDSDPVRVRHSPFDAESRVDLTFLVEVSDASVLAQNDPARRRSDISNEQA